MSEIKCGWCGKPFTAIRETAEYCSAKCSVYSHRRVTKPSVTPCVTPCLTPPNPELDRLAERIRRGLEMAERGRDAMDVGRAKLISLQAELIERLQAP